MHDNDNHEKINITILFIPNLMTPQPTRNIIYETCFVINSRTYKIFYVRLTCVLSGTLSLTKTAVGFIYPVPTLGWAKQDLWGLGAES